MVKAPAHRMAPNYLGPPAVAAQVAVEINFTGREGGRGVTMGLGLSNLMSGK